MDHRPKQFAFLAELFIDFNESVDDSVVAPAPLSPKRALGHFLFYSKGGERILCNPNPLNHPNPFLPLVPAVLFPTRDIMLPKSEQRPLPMPSCIHASLAQLNLNIIVEVFLLYQCFLLLWLDWLFLISSSLTGITDKGKPFERMGRKTTDLSNGRWVTELRSRISPAHSFEVKIGLFFMRNPGGHQEVNDEYSTESCDQAHRA